MSDSIYWVGLDVHADKVNAAVLRSDDSAPLEQWELVPDDRGLGRLAKRLKGYPGQVRCVYEAGPCGYELARHLRSREISCEVTAPGLIPKKPGDRVKTDRRDAFKLAHLYRAGELTMVAIPGPEQESLRDLLRAREDAKDDLLRRRHRLSKFLLRHGYRYRDGRAWTLRHWAWLRSIRFELPYAQVALEGYIGAVIEQAERVKEFDPLLEEAAQDPNYAARVKAYSALRGVATTTALTVIAEAGDLRRYRSAPGFMCATGLVSSEH